MYILSKNHTINIAVIAIVLSLVLVSEPLIKRYLIIVAGSIGLYTLVAASMAQYINSVYISKLLAALASFAVILIVDSTARYIV